MSSIAPSKPPARNGKRVDPELYQEQLADFYYDLTLGNPNWRAQEKYLADLGKLALEKVKIGARLNIEPKPQVPPVTIKIQQLFADGTTNSKLAVVGTVEEPE